MRLAPSQSQMSLLEIPNEKRADNGHERQRRNADPDRRCETFANLHWDAPTRNHELPTDVERISQRAVRFVAQMVPTPMIFPERQK
jgi:hypothetical protein